MAQQTASWKDLLADKIPPAWGREIDVFEKQIELRKQGKIEEKLFAETRLRRGVYGQRYDNGQRHDGEKTQELKFPCGDLTKGPITVWDAPGMMRIKNPFGIVTPEQWEVMAELAEEYSDQILHVTTRQDIQLHFIHIEDTPDLMRRLAAVGITTREACGNSVRNVTACQFSGVCNEEAFDVTPYAHGLAFFLLGHDDTQDFGRKLKIAFSGCKVNPCALVNFHDLGAIAKVKMENGVAVRGFELYVGGGLGSVPQPAELFDGFLPPEELLPMSQAICRIFARMGEKANRARARIKFLVKKLGIDEFRRIVLEERAKLRPDERWTAYLGDLHITDDKPRREGKPLLSVPTSPGYAAFAATNVRPQRQAHYSTVTIRLPLGDFTADQARALADLMRQYTSEGSRMTADQNITLRWVSNADIPAVYERLTAIGLGKAGANTISDITSCPGTDTCKLGISSSRSLAAELVTHLEARADTLHPATKKLVVKASGCFNSCGQHHVADLGFLGVSRNVNGRRVPHFQLVVGGKWQDNGGAYGLAVGAVPSKRVPEVLTRVTDMYIAERQGEETFHDYVNRVGKKAMRKIVEELQVIPSYEQDASLYSDWGDPREYTIGDMGVGECAGEIVPFVEMGLAAAEREVFEAQDLLQAGDVPGAARRAYGAMLSAAKALTKERHQNLGDGADEIAAEFKKHFFDTQVFFDPFAGGKFAQYFFRAHEDGGQAANQNAAHQLIEEAQLFVEAAHQCYARLGAQLAQTIPTAAQVLPGSPA